MVGHWWFMNAIMSGKLGNHPTPTPPEMMTFMHIIYVFVGFSIVVGTVLNILAAMFLRQRKHRMFTMVVAGLICLQFPFGTILGVFTFVVLMRESVRESYERLAQEN